MVTCAEELRATPNETDIMYTASARAALEAAKVPQTRPDTPSVSRSHAFLTPRLFPFLVLQAARSKNVVQGLSLGCGHIGVPEVHHEDHPGAVFCAACGVREQSPNLGSRNE